MVKLFPTQGGALATRTLHGGKPGVELSRWNAAELDGDFMDLDRTCSNLRELEHTGGIWENSVEHEQISLWAFKKYEEMKFLSHVIEKSWHIQSKN